MYYKFLLLVLIFSASVNSSADSNLFLDNELSSLNPDEAFLLPEAEPSDLNTSRSDVLVSDNTDDLINTNEANSEPSTFDDPNDPYLNQQIFDEAELASNDYCHPSTPPASRKAKPRKRAVDENQCSTSVDPASPPASPPAVELPTLETIKDLLLIQDPLQKKWCSKSVIPGFSNIPVCKTMEAYYRGSWLNGDAPPSLVLQGLTSSLYDIVGKLLTSPSPCPPQNVWCCMEFLPYRDDYDPSDSPWAQSLVLGRGYWCLPGG